MSWNHRVVVTEDGTHQVAEVFYSEAGKPISWGKTVTLAESVDELTGATEEKLHGYLLWAVRECTKALYLPVLYVRNGELTEVKE